MFTHDGLMDTTELFIDYILKVIRKPNMILTLEAD